MENEVMDLQNRLTELEEQEKDTNVQDLIKDKKRELLQTKDIQNLSQTVGEEDIKAQLSKEAVRIRSENIESAEKDFETETRQLRLDYLKEELKKDHTYKMKIIEKNSKYKQMLDKRRKMFGKYGYLYNCDPNHMIEMEDGDGNKYSIPQDFSFSLFVNKIRQFGRNLSKLDKPVLQTIKAIFFVGIGIGVLYILKKFNIL